MAVFLSRMTPQGAACCLHYVDAALLRISEQNTINSWYIDAFGIGPPYRQPINQLQPCELANSSLRFEVLSDLAAFYLDPHFRALEPF
jgi:hypothetical protein